MTLIDAVLTMPRKTAEAKYRRRIAAINAVVAFCDVEEGAPSRLHLSKRPAANAFDLAPPTLSSKRQQPSPIHESDEAFRQAIVSVYIKSPKQRPTICFICLGNPKLLDQSDWRCSKTLVLLVATLSTYTSSHFGCYLIL